MVPGQDVRPWWRQSPGDLGAPQLPNPQRAPTSAAEGSWRAPSQLTGFGGGRLGIPSSAAIRKVLKSKDPRQLKGLILSLSLRNISCRTNRLLAQGHQFRLARESSSFPPPQNWSLGRTAREALCPAGGSRPRYRYARWPGGR